MWHKWTNLGRGRGDISGRQNIFYFNDVSGYVSIRALNAFFTLGHVHWQRHCLPVIFFSPVKLDLLTLGLYLWVWLNKCSNLARRYRISPWMLDESCSMRMIHLIKRQKLKTDTDVSWHSSWVCVRLSLLIETEVGEEKKSGLFVQRKERAQIPDYVVQRSFSTNPGWPSGGLSPGANRGLTSQVP